jgi:hypothetical protein
MRTFVHIVLILIALASCSVPTGTVSTDSICQDSVIVSDTTGKSDTLVKDTL